MMICLADPTYIVSGCMADRHASDEQLCLPLVIRPSYHDLLCHPDAAAALAELRARHQLASRRFEAMNRRTAQDIAAGREFRDSPEAWVAAARADQTTRAQYEAAKRAFRRRRVPRQLAPGTAQPTVHVPTRSRAGNQVRESSAASRASSPGISTMWSSE